MHAFNKMWLQCWNPLEGVIYDYIILNHVISCWSFNVQHESIMLYCCIMFNETPRFWGTAMMRHTSSITRTCSWALPSMISSVPRSHPGIPPDYSRIDPHDFILNHRNGMMIPNNYPLVFTCGYLESPCFNGVIAARTIYQLVDFRTMPGWGWLRDARPLRLSSCAEGIDFGEWARLEGAWNILKLGRFMCVFLFRSCWGVRRSEPTPSHPNMVIFCYPAILGSTLLWLWIDEMCQSKSMGPDLALSDYRVIPQPINQWLFWIMHGFTYGSGIGGQMMSAPNQLTNCEFRLFWVHSWIHWEQVGWPAWGRCIHGLWPAEPWRQSLMRFCKLSLRTHQAVVSAATTILLLYSLDKYDWEE